MTELSVYAWLVAPLGLIIGVTFRVFLSGETLRAVSRTMDSLELDTVSGRKWHTVGEFLPRSSNKAILRLCLLQMQLLVFTWWFCLILTLSCAFFISYIYYDPNYALDAINNHVPGSDLGWALSIPIVLFLGFIVITIFVVAYRRRLLDLVEEMRK